MSNHDSDSLSFSVIRNERPRYRTYHDVIVSNESFDFDAQVLEDQTNYLVPPFVSHPPKENPNSALTILKKNLDKEHDSPTRRKYDLPELTSDSATADFSLINEDPKKSVSIEKEISTESRTEIVPSQHRPSYLTEIVTRYADIKKELKKAKIPTKKAQAKYSGLEGLIMNKANQLLAKKEQNPKLIKHSVKKSNTETADAFKRSSLDVRVPPVIKENEDSKDKKTKIKFSKPEQKEIFEVSCKEDKIEEVKQIEDSQKENKTLKACVTKKKSTAELKITEKQIQTVSQQNKSSVNGASDKNYDNLIFYTKPPKPVTKPLLKVKEKPKFEKTSAVSVQVICLESKKCNEKKSNKGKFFIDLAKVKQRDKEICKQYKFIKPSRKPHIFPDMTTPLKPESSYILNPICFRLCCSPTSDHTFENLNT